MTYPPFGQQDPNAVPWQQVPPQDPNAAPWQSAQPQQPGYPGAQQPGYGYPQAGAPGGYPPAQGFPPGGGFGQPGGYPQPGGFPQANPGYPGAPGFGQGYGGFQPAPSGGALKWVLIGGGVLVLLVVLAIAGSCIAGGGSDEDQIRALFDPHSSSAGRSCANDKKFFSKFNGMGKPPDVKDRPDIKVSINNIKVNGDTATATVSANGGGQSGSTTMYFRKESGDWTICLTDSPEFKRLQQSMPGYGS